MLYSSVRRERGTRPKAQPDVRGIGGGKAGVLDVPSPLILDAVPGELGRLVK